MRNQIHAEIEVNLPIFLITALSLVLATGASGVEYVPGVDSLPQEGVPRGAVTKHTWDASRIYPDATHEYWVYVPAQYTDTEPACVMVFQDGEGYVSPECCWDTPWNPSRQWSCSSMSPTWQIQGNW